MKKPRSVMAVPVLAFVLAAARPLQSAGPPRQGKIKIVGSTSRV